MGKDSIKGLLLLLRDQEGRKGSEEAVPGPSVFPSGEPGVSGDFWAGVPGVPPTPQAQSGLDEFVKERVEPWHGALSFPGENQTPLPQFPPPHHGGLLASLRLSVGSCKVAEGSTV